MAAFLFEQDEQGQLELNFDAPETLAGRHVHLSKLAKQHALQLRGLAFAQCTWDETVPATYKRLGVDEPHFA